MHIVCCCHRKCICELCSVTSSFELAREILSLPFALYSLFPQYLLLSLTLHKFSHFSVSHLIFSLSLWVPNFKTCYYNTFSSNSFSFKFFLLLMLLVTLFFLVYQLFTYFCLAFFPQRSSVHAYYSSKCLKHETKID